MTTGAERLWGPPALAAACIAAMLATSADARDILRAHVPRSSHHRLLRPSGALASRGEPRDVAAPRPPVDDLYRRRAYGVGGAVFGLGGQGGLSFAGSCADLRFAEPRSCGRGYGPYGNGLQYGFGLAR